MIDQLLQYDKELFLFLNGLGSDTWDAFWMVYTTKYTWIPLYAFLLYLIYKNYNTKILLFTIVVIVLMIISTDQITNVFKHGLERLRPCHDPTIQSIMRLVKESCGGKHGFFSAHASNSMAVAVFAGLMLRNAYKRAVFLLLFWAALMAYSRIYVGVHYPLDVMCGMIFGAISGYAFYTLNVFLGRRFIS